MFSLKRKWLIIQAYKHNEELHREWSHSYILEDNDEYLVAASIRASVVESDGRKWHTKEPAIFILPKNKWFNVIAMLKEDGVSYYVNIASPTLYDKGFIKYIDYDLDIKLYGDGTVKLLDVSEYKKHAEEQGYPDEIRDILNKSVESVYKLIKEKKYPFIDEQIHKYYDQFIKETSN